MRFVQCISKQQLQGMLSGWQLDNGFSLALAKMSVVIIGGNRLIKGGQRGVDDKVMVTRVIDDDTGRGNTCARKTESHGYRAGYHITVKWGDEIDRRIVGYWSRVLGR